MYLKCPENPCHDDVKKISDWCEVDLLKYQKYQKWLNRIILSKTSPSHGVKVMFGRHILYNEDT